jgi:hypothetical protein
MDSPVRIGIIGGGLMEREVAIAVYIAGRLLSGCEAETRLQMACAVSGFFVRNGPNPSRSEMEKFLREPPLDS